MADKTYSDPDLPYLRGLVESGAMEPYEAIYAVIKQLTETHIDGVTPSWQDPELAKLVVVCAQAAADDVAKLAQVVTALAKLVAIFV